MTDIVEFLNSLSNPVLALCAVYVAKSIHELNIKIAVVIERVDSHEHRLSRVEEKL